MPFAALMGPGYRNVVRGVGDFERGYLRAERTSADFAAAVKTGRYELLVIGRYTPGAAREERWARQAGFRKVAESSRMALYAGPQLLDRS